MRGRRCDRPGAGGTTLLRWAAACAAMAVLAVIGLRAPMAAAAAPNDGLAVFVSPPRVSPGDTFGFTLSVTDSNDSRADYDHYTISGVPTGWAVFQGTTRLSPTSPDPILYTVDKTAGLTGNVRIVPPSGFVGTLPGVTVSRPVGGPNLITDFDNGTFDYLGTAKPQLQSGSTPYTWSDPTIAENPILYGTRFCVPGSKQYAPCDGYYTIWPTTNMNGPDVDTSTPGVFTPPAHYNNFWADLRSVTNPMVTPSTNDICWAWDQTKPDTSNGINTRMVTPQEAAPAGKMFIVNGSTTLPNPHDVLSTTVSGLTPGATYSFSGQVANVSDSRAVVLPVRVGFYAKGGAGQITQIGSSNDLPKQSGCLNSSTHWTSATSLLTADSSGRVTLSLRNYAAGGFGNDFAIDSLTLLPMASVSVDLLVSSTPAPSSPGLKVSKSSNPASGSTVQAGDLITYTFTATNTGNVDLTVDLTDDLTNLRNSATLAGFVGAMPPQIKNDQPSLAVGETASYSFTVRVKDGLANGTRLRNTVTGSATYNDGGTTRQIQSNCQSSTWDKSPAECRTEHTIGGTPGGSPGGSKPGLTVSKSSNPASGSTVQAGDLITYTVTATNTGDVDLTVDLADDLTELRKSATTVGSVPLQLLKGTLGRFTLAAGTTATYSFTARVNTGLASGTHVRNTVTGSATYDDGGTTRQIQSTCQSSTWDKSPVECRTEHTIGSKPGLEVSKSSNPASGSTVQAGDLITYTVTAANTGNVDLTVDLTDDLTELSKSATVDGAVPPQLQTGQFSLAAGKTTSYSFTVRVNDGLANGTRLRNTVTGSATYDDGGTTRQIQSTCQSSTWDESPAECRTEHTTFAVDQGAFSLPLTGGQGLTRIVFAGVLTLCAAAAAAVIGRKRRR